MRIALVVMLSACGRIGFDPAGFDDDGQSGTRLKHVRHQVDDLSVPTRRIHDAARDEGCFSQLWDDGKRRCTPFGGFVAYLDAECTQPIGVASSCTPQRYFIDRDFISTGGTSRVLLFGPPLATQPVNIFFGADPTRPCIQSTSPGSIIHELGAEVPRDSFQVIDRKAPTGSGRIQRRFDQSADGFRILGELVDTVAGTACIPLALPDRVPCIFTRGQDANVATENTCAERLVEHPGPTLPDVGALSSRCFETRYFALEAPVVPSSLFRAQTTQCLPASPNPAMTYFPLGDEIVPVALTRQLDSAIGRIAISRLQTAGFDTREDVVFDKQLDELCSFRTMADGSTACIPRYIPAPQVITGFTDPACTQSIDLATFFDDECGFPAPRYVSREDNCGRSSGIHGLTGIYTGQVFQLAGACVELGSDPSRRLFTIDPALVDLATATEQIDP